jgi:hypothetical protein
MGAYAGRVGRGLQELAQRPDVRRWMLEEERSLHYGRDDRSEVGMTGALEVGEGGGFGGVVVE